MGSVESNPSNMKVFLLTLLVAAVSCDQSHHQAIKLGNAPSVSHAVHKPHGAYHASVSSQPHAAPQSVHGYGGYEKPVTAVHAPAAVPSYQAAPVYKAAPVYHAAPVYKAAPIYHAPKPVYHAPARAYHAPKPAYHEPSYSEPAAYSYQYGVADDYSGSRFNAQESRDGYATTGSYSVDLPDGRTQTVNYNVADVQYSGEPHYAATPAYKPAPAYHA